MAGQQCVLLGIWEYGLPADLMKVVFAAEVVRVVALEAWQPFLACRSCLKAHWWLVALMPAKWLTVGCLLRPAP